MWCLFAHRYRRRRKFTDAILNSMRSLAVAVRIHGGALGMLYKISMITEEDGWIVLDTDGWASEPIRLLVQSVAEEMGKEVFQPYEGDAQFMIKGDPYKLIFQYDDVFGSCVILDRLEDRDAVVALLEHHFAKLKNKQE